MPKPDKFKFKKSDSIGAAAAEQDSRLLESCFINTGDVEQLRDCANPRRIVLGRTGAGKTALLLHLSKCESRTIEVQPESLALAHISNSTILRFFSDLGVNLDIFFRLLWRHVFTVEILKRHFQIEDEQTKRSFLDKIYSLFQDKRHRRAVDYIHRWGEHFWEDTEYRIQEVTTKLEENLKSTVGVKFPGLKFDSDDAKALSQTEKAEVVQRAQKVINEVQIKELSEVLKFLDDVLDDRQKRYYIVIDRLDEDWIEESLRFKLIRALVETVKDFSTVHNAKIIAAIRLDLLERVFRRTRDSGFQEEKFESLYLPVEWQKADLVKVLEARMNRLIESRFGKAEVTWQDVMVKEVEKQPTIDYMIDRTMMRPRDLIQFFNFCIGKAVDRPQISVQMIRDAEGEYSRNRLRSLADEWFADFPNLMTFTPLLEGRNRTFGLNEITDAECGDFALNFLSQSTIPQDDLASASDQFINLQIDGNDFRRNVFYVFYRVGLVGLRTQACEQVSWAISGRRSVSRSEVPSSAGVSIHRMFWRVFHAKA